MAIAVLKESNLELTPISNTFPQELEKRKFSRQFWNHSKGTESSEGLWAQGSLMDGNGEFEYIANPGSPDPEATPPPSDHWKYF